jgi:quinohemoprotein ethanol dehydrogenase
MDIRRHLTGLTAALLIAPLLLAAPRQYGAVDDARLRNAQQEPQNWLTHGGNWEEQRYSKLAQIHTGNVSQLKPAWWVEFDTTRSQEATPIVVDGVMYVSTAWSKVYALDAKTGKQIWYFDPKVPGPAASPTCCDVNNRGVAVYLGKVYIGTLDGRLIALDAKTGKIVWNTMTVEPGRIYSITGAPRVARGKVFIGNAGADVGGRGYVSAYDANNGKLVWRFYMVPGDPKAKPDGAASDDVLAKIAAPTWFGQWYKYGGGAHVWNAIVFDPDLNQLYLPTGNAFPWNPHFRSEGKGDNLFVSSIVAVDADTGQYRWHYQETPGDAWDYDAISDITLVDLRIDGAMRKVLMHAPKNGFFYLIDRASGKLLSAEPFVPGINWATHVDKATGRPAIVEAALYRDGPWMGVPGGGGAHNWNPVAYSPKTGLLYIPASENSTYFNPTKEFNYVEGNAELGIDLLTSFTPPHGATTGTLRAGANKGYLMAWNPVTQTAAWRAGARGGGVLATAGDLVFQGRNRDGLLGEFLAFRADNGEQLWSINTPDAISAGPVTYSVDGEQYVAVTSGASVMSFGAKARVPHFGSVMAFKLNGTATLGPEPPLAPPANPPAEIASLEIQMEGAKLYAAHCARCHGFDAVGANVIPDLRRSPMLTDPRAWHGIVIEGLRAERGMIGWSRFISADQAELIRKYLGERARALASTGP